MTDGDDQRDMLAAALGGADIAADARALAAAEYHGVGPLIFARTGVEALKAPALARAMWELRHRQLLAGLLAALESGGVQALVIKGTALAYDLYPEAAQRPRGDTDLLVSPADLEPARAILSREGFTLAMGEQAGEGASQEVWQITPPGGTSHDIDLHWQAFNGPSLAEVMPVAEAMAEGTPLPRLSPQARGLSRVHGLLHSCLHRAQHILSPYFVDGEAHYGGDRLIWLCDIDLLARALTQAEWESFTTRSITRGVAPVCHGALAEAQRLLATPLPADAMARLASAPAGPAAHYLLDSGRRARAISDLKASGAGGALRYLRARLLPPAALVRGQYPQSRLPLPFLYLRRLGRFLAGGRP